MRSVIFERVLQLVNSVPLILANPETICLLHGVATILRQAASISVGSGGVQLCLIN